MKKFALRIFVTAVAVGLCAVPVVAGTIKVGAIIAETGPAGFLGKPEANTLEMVVEQINESGGIAGNKIELILKDSAGKKENAVSFAKQLIEEDKVFAIVGPTRSGSTMAIKNLCEQAKMILISCASTKAIVDPVAKYVFKTPQNDSLAVEKIFGVMQKQHINKIAVVVGGTGFGKMGKKFLNELAPAFNIEVVANETYSPKVTDLSAVVAKLKSNNDIQAVVNWSIVPAQTILAKNMRQAGWDVPLFQSHGFGNINYVKAGGVSTEGLIFPAGRLLVADSLPDDNPQKAVLVEYKNAYEAKYKEPVSTFGGHAYDSLLLLTKAIEKAGVVDKEKVRDALETLTVPGTGGVFKMTPEDHSGLDIDAFVMMVVKDGAFVPYSAK